MTTRAPTLDELLHLVHQARQSGALGVMLHTCPPSDPQRASLERHFNNAVDQVHEFFEEHGHDVAVVSQRLKAASPPTKPAANSTQAKGRGA